jgi:hypothetical protein
MERALRQRLVTCANKRPHSNPHEGITRLGGPNWGPLTRVYVVTLIEAHLYNFVVLAGAHRAELRVVREQGKRPYLRASADGAWTDLLLELPRCPRAE